MTDISLSASAFAEREFRIGDAMNKAIQIWSRNVLPFSVVTGIAALPSVLIFERSADFDNLAVAASMSGLGMLLALVLSGLSQAVVLNAAFEDMRGRPVDMLASFQVGFRRFLPVIGVTLLTGLLTGLAAIALIFPAFMV